MPYRRILVPINGTDDDRRILELAGLLAERKQPDITIVFVVEVRQALPLDASLPEAVADGESALQRAESYAHYKAEHKSHRVTLELLQARSAGAAIVDEAIQRDIDLIVMGCRNRLYMGRTTVGATVPYVLKNAPCDVILTRFGEDD